MQYGYRPDQGKMNGTAKHESGWYRLPVVAFHAVPKEVKAATSKIRVRLHRPRITVFHMPGNLVVRNTTAYRLMRWIFFRSASFADSIARTLGLADTPRTIDYSVPWTSQRLDIGPVATCLDDDTETGSEIGLRTWGIGIGRGDTKRWLVIEDD